MVMEYLKKRAEAGAGKGLEVRLIGCPTKTPVVLPGSVLKK